MKYRFILIFLMPTLFGCVNYKKGDCVYVQSYTDGYKHPRRVTYLTYSDGHHWYLDKGIVKSGGESITSFSKCVDIEEQSK